MVFPNVYNKGIALIHYSDFTMSTMASQIISLKIVYSTVYSGADQRKHQSFASLVFVREFTGDRWIRRTKGLVTRKMFPFDDVIMNVVNSANFISWLGDVDWEYVILRHSLSLRFSLSSHKMHTYQYIQHWVILLPQPFNIVAIRIHSTDIQWIYVHWVL